MHFGKAVTARAMQQDDAFCEAEFLSLVERLEALPDAERGRFAIALSALLVEYSAFELAGRCDSRMVGELVEIAARLAGQAEELTRSPPRSGGTARRTLQ